MTGKEEDDRDRWVYESDVTGVAVTRSSSETRMVMILRGRFGIYVAMFDTLPPSESEVRSRVYPGKVNLLLVYR